MKRNPMRFTRFARRLAVLCAAIYIATVLGTGIFVWTYEPPDELPEDALVIVLGAGIRADGSASRASVERARAAAELVLDGIGQRILITGGPTPRGPGAVATAMAAEMREFGVDASAIAVEIESRSTLQNALFTRDMIDPETASGPVILITQRFHLPRSWASFRWAGHSDLTLYPSDPAPRRLSRGLFLQLMLEGAKWPMNLARATVASLGLATGVSEEIYIPLLD